MHAEPDWPALRDLEATVLKHLSSRGVVRVEYVVTFSEPFTFWMWLGTALDAERNALAAEAAIGADLKELAATHGMSDLYEGHTIESQETVDRDYEGNWLYRLR